MEIATVKVIYNSKDITADISDHLLNFSYTDKTAGESDELDINLEDSERLWQFSWFPQTGAKITASINDGRGGILNCGVFTLDEIEQAGGVDGDFISFKCIAAGIGTTTRTKNNSVHSNKTLREIANTIAARHGFKVQGTIQNVSVGYIAQHKETDLHFLKRVALDYGHVFSLRDNTLIFTDVFELEKRGASLIVNRADLVNYNFTDKTAETFKKARVRHHNPGTKKLVEYTTTENGVQHSYVKGDTLEVHGRAENEGQAALKSRAALHHKNSHQTTGTFSMPGNVLAVAGNNAEFTGLGRISGLYHLMSSTHTVTKDGAYITDGEIKRVGLVSSSKQNPL